VPLRIPTRKIVNFSQKNQQKEFSKFFAEEISTFSISLLNFLQENFLIKIFHQHQTSSRHMPIQAAYGTHNAQTEYPKSPEIIKR